MNGMRIQEWTAWLLEQIFLMVLILLIIFSARGLVMDAVRSVQPCPASSPVSWRPPAVIRRSGGYFNQPAGLPTRNTPEQYKAAFKLFKTQAH